jgi:hypothetical protein
MQSNPEVEVVAAGGDIGIGGLAQYRYHGAGLRLGCGGARGFR